MMTMTSVNSVAVSAVGYENGVLHITYRSSGKTYLYSGVPYATYEALMASDSIGKFILQHIRKQFTGHEAG